jgi:glycosyltransferase involved in cell wall biosynthesis
MNKDSMNRISAVIITYNEEYHIERCLQSVQDIADEIIVVDSLSTDHTEEICRRYGVAFYRQQWLGYGAQKNLGNGKAVYPYILSVDADEALDDTLKASIMEMKSSPVPKDAYRFNRLTNYCGQKWIRHCGWYPDAKVRLWRKEVARWDLTEVHECLIFDRKISVAHLKGDLLHYTYRSIAEHIRIADKYTSLAARKYFLASKKSSNLVVIAFRAWFCFIRDYFFRLGFLDGYYGYVICRITAFSTFLKYIKLNHLHKK